MPARSCRHEARRWLWRGVLAPRARRGTTVADLGGRPVELTHREWEVLVLVRQARSTAGIAHRLVVCRVTVRPHGASLVRKLRVVDRAQQAASQIDDDRLRHDVSDP